MISSIAIRRVGNAVIRGRKIIASGSVPKIQNLSCTSDILCANFSTNPQQQQGETFEFTCPPNLKIDPNITSSPFEKVKKEIASISIDDDNDDVNVADSHEDDEDEDDDAAYEMIAKKIEPTYVTPLPKRLHVPIIDLKSNSEAGTIHLSPSAFGQDPIREDILHRCVVYLRNKKRGRRNGGARTKTIGEVSGSGRKVRNQKGGGVARAGHSRPAHWRGGAKAHGPKGSIQNYETKLNKKVRKMGIQMALSQKLKEGNLILVNSFSELGTYKTKFLSTTLLDVAGIGGVDGTSALIVDHVLEGPISEDGGEDEEQLVTSLGGVDINLKVASENIFRTKVTNQKFVNVYDLLKHEKLVMTLSALEKLEERY